MQNEDIFSTDVEKVLPALKLELERLKTIWLPRGRDGDGEAGRLLEEALSVSENNRDEADIPIGDLKTYKVDKKSSEKITLFSKDKGTLLPKEIIYSRFSFAGTEHPKSLQSQVTSTPNGQNFFYHCEVDGVYLACGDTDIQFWSWDLLTEVFTKKFPSVLAVEYDTKTINGIKHFQFTNAYYYPKGDTALNAFFDELKAGNVVIEVRRYMKTETAERNRGTAFRVSHEVFNRIFQTRQTII